MKNEYEEGDWGVHVTIFNGDPINPLYYCHKRGNYLTAREARESVEESLEWDD